MHGWMLAGPGDLFTFEMLSSLGPDVWAENTRRRELSLLQAGGLYNLWCSLLVNTAWWGWFSRASSSKKGEFHRFYCASYASAALGVVILSVRPSVRPSNACFVTNPKNLPATFLYHLKGQSFHFSDAKDLGKIPTGSPPTGAPNTGGVG